MKYYCTIVQVVKMFVKKHPLRYCPNLVLPHKDEVFGFPLYIGGSTYMWKPASYRQTSTMSSSFIVIVLIIL